MSKDIWNITKNYLDVYKIKTNDASAVYNYHWSNEDYMKQQINALGIK